jgi:hypothetical protein
VEFADSSCLSSGHCILICVDGHAEAGVKSRTGTLRYPKSSGTTWALLEGAQAMTVVGKLGREKLLNKTQNLNQVLINFFHYGCRALHKRLAR